MNNDAACLLNDLEDEIMKGMRELPDEVQQTIRGICFAAQQIVLDRRVSAHMADYGSRMRIWALQDNGMIMSGVLLIEDARALAAKLLAADGDSTRV